MFAFYLMLISCSEKEISNVPNNEQNDSTIVGIHGLLQVDNNKIVDAYGEAISLAGNSFFWSNDNWGG